MQRLVLAVVLTLAFSQSVGGTPLTPFCTDFNAGAAAGFTGVADTESVDFFGVIVDGNSVLLETFRDFDISDQSCMPLSGVQLVFGAASGFGNWGVDSAYDMGLDPVFDNIPHRSNTLAMEWFATVGRWQGGRDESWAIDNVEVLLKDTIAHGHVSISELSTVPPPKEMTTVQAPEKAAHEAKVKKVTTSDKHLPLRDYEKAYGVYQEHRYDEALTLFQDFLRQYPQHDLADNAQYWIGEIYYDLEDYANAILAFKEVVTRYAEDNKAPDALLKIGYAYVALDDPTHACIFIKRVIKNYPFSEAGSKARAKLKELEN
jgi:tol-pal system protein YbgF